MKKWQMRCVAMLLLGIGVQLSGAELLWEGCQDTEYWQFYDGDEFPGAKGGIEAKNRGIVLRYDFQNGGEYVSAGLEKPLTKSAETVQFELESANEVEITFRVEDAEHRIFQQRSVRLPGRTPTTLALPLQGEWAGAWGGDSGEYDQPRLPIQRIWINAGRHPELAAAGTIEVRAVRLTGDDLTPAPFHSENFSGRLAEASWRGEWRASTQGIELDLTCEVTGDEPLELSCDFPRNGRALVRRFTVNPGTEQLTMHFPAENPRNLYRVILTAQCGEESLQRTLRISGDQADPSQFGLPRSSKEIQTARFGCSVHFGFAGDPDRGVRWWHDYKTLIDDMSRCGVKVLRGELKYSKDPVTGQFRVDDYDRAWAAYAKAAGMEVIFLINEEFGPDTPLADFEQMCADLALDTQELIDIFEIFNEPGGPWIKAFGGTWNAREPDNSTSPWALEVLRFSNAGAEAIKRVRPDCTVIGLGSAPPINVRMLTAGVTPALDGVVDHPYNYSMPPEKVPWGEAFRSRDGVVVGDADSTFVGMIRGYEEAFKRLGTPRSLWFTEFGFSTFRFNGHNENALYAGFTEEAQAVYLLRRLLLTLAFPIIKVAAQYDYLDDYYSIPYEPEANFGIIRADHSKKPSWYVTQRFHSIFSETVPAEGVVLRVTAEPLHRSARRDVLIPDWDNSVLMADNEVMTLTLVNPYRPDDRFGVVWSTQPYSGEFNNRAVALELTGWKVPPEWDALVALDLVTGRSFDVAIRREDGKILIDCLELEQHPLLLRF